MARKPESRRLIEKILWDPHLNPEDFQLTYIHREAEGDRRTIPLSSVLNVRGSWLTFTDGGEEKRIPLHRVVSIYNVKEGKPVWVKAQPPPTSQKQPF